MDNILDVPYLSQRNLDKKHKSDVVRACNVTCLAMVLQYHHVPKITPEVLLDFLDERIPLSFAQKMFGNIPQVRNKNIEQIWRMLEFSGDWAIGGLESALRNEKFATFTYNTFDEIDEEIDKGFPVIVGGAFTKSGHYVVIKGNRTIIINKMRKTEGYVVNDPWGEWFPDKRSYKNHNGENCVFKKETLDRLLHNAYKDSGGNWSKKRVLLVHPKG